MRRVFEGLAAQADPGVGIVPGAINAQLRELGSPMGAWEVRLELTNLEAAGEVRCDPATGRWHQVSAGAQQSKKRSSA